MTILTRVCSIVQLSICLLIRWLAGNSHKLSEYNWSVRSMGYVLDLLENALKRMIDNYNKILDDNFMMSIFDEICNEVPPFAEYIKHIYEKNDSSCCR